MAEVINPNPTKRIHQAVAISFSATQLRMIGNVFFEEDFFEISSKLQPFCEQNGTKATIKNVLDD
ncbi:hypothetical protein [Veronia nyctiphanis]|uniref:hypothetical protein n=1 Tax=Veronia nyctiphanis TaxID=1278244 RepID=UPI0011AE1EF3|nr:hypothetical protein [Veronia nyctiphanis]